MTRGSRRLVLFVSELGAGRGHIARLNSVARVARQIGCQTALAARSGLASKEAFADWSFDTLIEPPRLPRLRNPPPILRSPALTSVLANAGFIDQQILAGVARQWEAIIAAQDPAMIVGDFAPYARLASLQRIPFLMIGSGYAIPPADGLAPFDEGRARYDNAALSDLILRRANDLLARSQRSAMTSAATILRGDWTAVGAIPLLDPIAQRTADERFGPFADFPARTPACGTTGAVYAYLHDLRDSDRQLLSELASIGMDVSLFSDALRHDGNLNALPRDIRRLTRLREVADIADSTGAVYHRGGLGLSTACAVLGIPQILAPLHAEARMTAVRLADHQLGRIVDRRRPADRGAVEDIRAWCRDPAVREHRMAVSDQIRDWIGDRPWRDRITEILRRCFPG